MRTGLLLLSLFVQSQTDGVADGIDLDPSTRPALPLPLFRKLKCITANEYPPKKDQKLYIRVFRYSYSGDFDRERDKWQKAFSEAAGWTVFIEGTNENQLIIDRLLPKNPVVRRQTIIFSRAKLTYDPKAPERTRFERVPGWVRISYNEEYRKKPPPAKVLK